MHSDKRQFSALGLSPALLAVLGELKFVEMTSIQAQAIPLLVAGKDVVGQSETGSGKTAAFAIPLLENLDLERRELQALVICPTRELCAQVAQQIRTLGRRHQNLQVLTVTGGQRLGPQRFALEKGVHVVVGTPGRLVDHLTRRTLNVGALRTLVLDEADRMLDMGFEEDMKRIVSSTPKSRQTALFSATIPSSLNVLLGQLLKDPVFIKVDEGTQPLEITQSFYWAESNEKSAQLLHLLATHQPESAIVFCNQKATVKEVTQTLCRNGIGAACLHGDLEQFDRDREMAKFRNQSTRVLVATDVAARGIDVSDLDLVLNYDLPKQPETYVHRIGRTGRAGKTGAAVTFVHPREQFRVTAIEELTNKTFVLEDLDQKRPMGRVHLPPRMKTIYVAGGKKNKVRPTDLLGALTGTAGNLAGNQVGKIDIGDHFSYVAVETAVAKAALDGLRSGKIKGRRFKAEFVR